MLVKILEDYYLNPDHVSVVCIRGGVVSVIMKNKTEVTFTPKEDTMLPKVIEDIAAKINKRK